MPGDNAKPCDTGLALDDVDADRRREGDRAVRDARTTTDRKYGVLSAAYVRADGDRRSPPRPCRSGIQPAWGTNVHVQGGATMLAHVERLLRAPSGRRARATASPASTNATAHAAHGLPGGRPRLPADAGHRRRRRARAADPRAHERDGLLVQLQVLLVRVPRLGVRHAAATTTSSSRSSQPPPMGAYVPTGSTLRQHLVRQQQPPRQRQHGLLRRVRSDDADAVRLALQSAAAARARRFPARTARSASATSRARASTCGTRPSVPPGRRAGSRRRRPPRPARSSPIRFAIWDAGNARVRLDGARRQLPVDRQRRDGRRRHQARAVSG